MILPTPKKPEYTSVRFRKPGHKGETWYVSVHKMGGGPHTKDGVDLRIPARFRADVLQTMTGRYHVYTLADFEEFVKLKKIDDFPPAVMKRLYKKCEAFCNKNGYVNVDPRWK